MFGFRFKLNIFETNIVLVEKAAKGWDLHVALFARFETPVVTSFKPNRAAPTVATVACRGRSARLGPIVPSDGEHCQCPPAGQLEGSVPLGQCPRTRAVTMTVTVNLT